MLKRLLALLLSVVMLLSMAACSADDDDDEDDDRKSHSGSVDKFGEEEEDENRGENLPGPTQVKLTIGMPANARIMDYEENAFVRWLEEQTGYELEFQFYSGGSNIGTQLATAVAADQTLPDVLIGVSLADDVINNYGRRGYFADLQNYYADRDGASRIFWERLEETFSEAEQENILRLMTDPETGAMYCVPTLETSLVDTMDYQMWINQTWLDECNLEAPTNLDELYNVLVTFKQNYPGCIPLYGSGSRDAILGADVINWLINNFIYFNDRKHFNVTDTGELYAPFTTDEYREALKFVNRLIDEGLMPDTVFDTKSHNIKMVTTPANGEAMVGVFAGHLTLHVVVENEVLYQYTNLAPLQGQYCVYNDNTNRRQNFITVDCANPDAAFNLMMTLWSEEAYYRMRYGEYGVNWDDADPGAVSDYGLPAKIRVIRDPLMETSDGPWFFGSTLAVYAEGENVQFDYASSPWQKYRSELHAASRELFDEAADKNNPKNICPTLNYTAEEKEEIEAIRSAVEAYYKQASNDFMSGKLDPNDQAQWDNYLQTLNDYGLQEYLELAQKAYNRW